MAEELPFRAEYAKSSRSSCKGCKEQIPKDSLRLAIMVQSPMFDGKMPLWHHFNCFFGKQKVKTVGDIEHFDSLRWEDQKKIKEKIASPEASDSGSASPVDHMKDFSTEYAKSNRSTCRGCDSKIEKGVVRVSKKDYESQRSKMYGPQPMWYHVDCFVENREKLEFYESAEKIPGFRTLGVEDQKSLREKLKKVNGKRKCDTVDGPLKKQKTTSKEEKKLKVQNEQLYKYHDLLKMHLGKKQLQELLEYNQQKAPSGTSKLLSALSDCMVFGALEPCEECEGGQLTFHEDGYHCTGNVTGWTKCAFVTKTPNRKPFKIPKQYLEDFDFLKNYKYEKRNRLFPTQKEGPSKPSTSKEDGSQPLEGIKLAIVGKLPLSKDKITAKVEKLGGKLVTKVDKTVACVISTEDDVKNNNKKLQTAKEADVHVVSIDFLDAVQKGGVALMIQQCSIASWGGNLEDRIADPVKSTKSNEEKYFTKSVPEKVKMKVKGGAAVDPDSGLEDKAHVLEESKSIYNAVLGMVDISRGTNSFYKLQVLESDKMSSYWVFRSWGRVGTTIGGNKLEKFPTKLDAILEFKRLYEEKTGNVWEQRENFVKHPNKFYPLEIDYGQDEEDIQIHLKPGSRSKLPKSVQELICMIFDVEKMKKAMVEFEIDMKKMPLGKLSKRQIESAYSVLTELQELIKTKGSQMMFLDASNRFYTLIPHDFGMKKPPLLDNEEIIKNKLEMLDSLLEIEVAYNLLKDASSDSNKDPIDVHYEQLKTKIEVVDKECDDFKMLESYVRNTHAETHNTYTLDVMEVFKINRQGEAKRYKPFKKLHNRKLLWHGSRVTNYVGILSQGLRIAPPEAPVTGYMFGKGIYFADMVSKSANYCHTNKNNPEGLMMLCEVALGNMYEKTQAEMIQQLPQNKHSTKGIGRTEPDPQAVITTPDGTEVPLGKPVSSPVTNTSLLYNEYIVYDTAQVNIKYLLKLKFNWKY